MTRFRDQFFFDKLDHELLRIVDDVLTRGKTSSTLRSLLGEHMHPHGIKELAAPRGLRIAYAIASLLDSFEQGRPRNRIRALRSLRDEVLLSSATDYQRNTARVLVQIMKELIRCGDDSDKRLRLAHDFRMASTGNRRQVRAELAKYHLLEMPEEWNQYAFDDHVHDASTKGRKSPTHLVMDAWIKGIRHLGVIYYNYVEAEVIEELLEASALLDISVQVGIEMSARFRDKYVRLIWQPQGLDDKQAFLGFLQNEKVREVLAEGRLVSDYQQRYVFEVLQAFNEQHRHELSATLQLPIPAISTADFRQFVGTGQPSILHLARFIQGEISKSFRDANGTAGDDSPGPQASAGGARVDRFNIEAIIKQYLAPAKNPALHDPNRPSPADEAPALLKLAPRELLARLLSLHSGSRFSLSLSNLSIQDTLEVLYSCEGMITHLEAYNLKDAIHGLTASEPAAGPYFAGDAVDLKSPDNYYSLISALQQALNQDNVISLKRVLREIIWDYDEQYHQLLQQVDKLKAGGHLREELQRQRNAMLERKEQLLDILYNLEKFHNYYKNRTLGSRIGTDSTSQSSYQYGMGLVIVDTLPPRSQKQVAKEIVRGERTLLPISARLIRNRRSRSLEAYELGEKITFFGRTPLFGSRGFRQWQDWTLDGLSVHPKESGNIIPLGGIDRRLINRPKQVPERRRSRRHPPWHYLNTNLKNSLKVMVGFIPAFLTFYLTKDWWLLSYFGAVIWFAITGSRNILQSILGGGGLKRSRLLPWNSLVSWSRIADSLLYTGFSVPLLDYLVKSVLLDAGLGVTTATAPVLLYTIMGVANGIYISSHNAFRGLPKSAVFGNFFRSILAIPLAVLLNAGLGGLLGLVGVVDVAGVLQKWAAIISKFASDCVAAVIEGLADRQSNIRIRLSDYRLKISQLFAVFSRLDLFFPEEDVLDILLSPRVMIETLNYEARAQEKYLIVNALDLMYFWLYQPRARKAMEIIFTQMTREEWLIFYRSQLVLKRYKEISQVFVDGLVGRNFSRALAFYLDNAEAYLGDLETLGMRRKWL